MTGKDRMTTAVHRGIPDRLPVTVHQWQPYHLQHHMDGMDQVEAFDATGLDAAVTPTDVLEMVQTPRWRHDCRDMPARNGWRMMAHKVDTPGGELCWSTATNQYTTFYDEHPLKDRADAQRFARYWPGQRLNSARLNWWYDRTGDRGIVRGFVTSFVQPGPWQELCELAGTEKAILWAMDEPAFVHDFLDRMTATKVAYVHDQLAGARFDLIEHGGGAASSTVISPRMFDEFCVPYDRRIIDALHEVGLPVVYHTCGGMMAILDLIPANGCDASETLSPPQVGGDIEPNDRRTVKHRLGSHVALIGGIDQGDLLTHGSPAQIEDHVRACFESFGEQGGYICCPSDRFFETPVQNLRELAEAAKTCRY